MLTESGRYDEIRSLYIDQLTSVWVNNSMTEEIRASFRNKVNSFTQGELKHATEMLSTLWGVINRDGEIKAPSNTSQLGVSPGLAFFRVARECSLHMISLWESESPPIGPL